VSALDVDQLEAGTATVVANCVNPKDARWAGIVDGAGGLWAAEDVEGRLTFALWSTAQQSQSCLSSPTTSFSSAFNSAAQLAFDPQGNLWIATGGQEGTGGIQAYMYSAAHLRQDAGASVAEDAWISWSCSSDKAACGGYRLAFDAQGYLWLVTVRSIVAYSPATLADAGTSGAELLGDFFLSTPAALDGMANFGDIIFDAEGNLWVVVTDATYTNDQILEFSAAQVQAPALAQDPTPTPVRIWSGLNGINGSFGAFDTGGNLWITGESNGTEALLRFAPGGADGGPDLVVPVAGDLGADNSLAFDPIPPGLPIYP